MLRAKQAATAQFSGTANLGQSRDLGTKGNNAMDQAINNPANDGYVEKTQWRLVYLGIYCHHYYWIGPMAVQHGRCVIDSLDLPLTLKFSTSL